MHKQKKFLFDVVKFSQPSLCKVQEIYNVFVRWQIHFRFFVVLYSVLCLCSIYIIVTSVQHKVKNHQTIIGFPAVAINERDFKVCEVLISPLILQTFSHFLAFSCLICFTILIYTRGEKPCIKERFDSLKLSHKNTLKSALKKVLKI